MKREHKMKLHAEATTWRTAIGKGQAFVVGLPSDFNLIVAPQNEGTVQLATAFAHRSGWQHFRKGISEGHALVALLTGLEFFETEPELLREWLDLKSKEAIRIDAKLASDKLFFHPKVLIVTGGSQRLKPRLCQQGSCYLWRDLTVLGRAREWRRRTGNGCDRFRLR